ncbi:DUF5958 family protein [Streptomyces tendae]|uniref:DUF5958 family protein n=1 Tax=Streptomyces tendae TaxID=1932 RepID=UPI0036495632
MNGRVVVLNELTQGIRPLAQGVDWFEGLTDTEQFEVLRDLGAFCIQARATSEDAREHPQSWHPAHPHPGRAGHPLNASSSN